MLAKGRTRMTRPWTPLNTWTPERIIDALQQARANGIVVRYRREWAALGMRPSVWAIATRFGSWDAALQAAGIVKPGKRLAKTSGDTTSIALSDGSEALVDAADLPLVVAYNWRPLSGTNTR